MKLNEALLIGGALLAALVLSKGGVLSSNGSQFSGKSPVLVLPTQNEIENQKISLNIPDLEIFKQFFPVTNTEIQLKQVLNIEEEKKNQRVSYLQNELDQTRSYITREQGTAQVDQYGQDLTYNKYNKFKAYLYSSDVASIQSTTGRKEIKSEDIINYYENLIESESALGYGGRYTGGASRKFPKLSEALTNYYNVLIAKRNITKAEVYAEQQQEGINLLEEEYQTRFGGLSRYG